MFIKCLNRVLVLCVLCASPLAWAEAALAVLTPQSAEALLPQAARTLLQSPALHTRFSQERRLSGLPMPLKSEGELRMLRGKGVDWAVQKPVQVRYTLTPQALTESSATGKKRISVAEQPGLAAASQLMLALFALDFARLGQDFEIAGKREGGQWLLQLKPRNAAMRAVFAEARLSGGAQLDQLQMVDGRGDSTRLRFAALTPITADAAFTARFSE